MVSSFSCSSSECFVIYHTSAGEKTGTDHDERIASFRERFEAIIKTDGEDSGPGSWAGFFHPNAATHPLPPHAVPPAVHLASGYPGTMPGAWDAHGSNEKKHTCKACKEEKAINEVA